MAQDEARYEKEKKRNLTLSDSDEEEEALIEEAEKEREPAIQEPPPHANKNPQRTCSLIWSPALWTFMPI